MSSQGQQHIILPDTYLPVVIEEVAAARLDIRTTAFEGLIGTSPKTFLESRIRTNE